MFERTISTLIQSATRSFPVVYLTGPRQSGKTTLVRSLFPDWNYVLLEAPDRLLEIKSDPRGFLDRDVKGWIFDEAQCYPELFSYLQEYVDGPDRRPVILTGSQNFLLNQQISQSLAGRAGVYELLPLSAHEIRSQSDGQKLSLFELLFKGMYPRPYAEPVSSLDWYSSYIQTYLERDVRQLSQIADLSKFQLFLKLCAGRVGQLLNLESISGDCGVTQPTAKRWLSILESSRIVFLLQPHHKNYRKRLVKTPKLYFYDTSLICGLTGIGSVEQLETNSNRGSIFESFILSELMKYFLNSGRRPTLNFWRDHRGLEVDCLVEHQNELFAMEIKSAKTLAEDFTKSLKTWQRSSRVEDSQLALFYGGDKKSKLGGMDVWSWRDVHAYGEEHFR